MMRDHGEATEGRAGCSVELELTSHAAVATDGQSNAWARPRSRRQICQTQELLGSALREKAVHRRPLPAHPAPKPNYRPNYCEHQDPGQHGVFDESGAIIVAQQRSHNSEVASHSILPPRISQVTSIHRPINPFVYMESMWVNYFWRPRGTPATALSLRGKNSSGIATQSRVHHSRAHNRLTLDLASCASASGDAGEGAWAKLRENITLITER
jgi:hypothetical protein